MVFNFDIVRSGAISAEVFIDERPLEICDMDAGCLHYKAELKAGKHHMDIYLSKIVKSHGDKPLTMGIYLMLGEVEEVLKDALVQKISLDIDIDDTRDTVYMSQDGIIIDGRTTARILNCAHAKEYESKSYKFFIRFSAIFTIPLLLAVSSFLLLFGVSNLVRVTDNIFTAIVSLVVGALFIILTLIYIISLIRMKSRIAKYERRGRDDNV